MSKIRVILIYSFLMGIVTGFSQATNSFIVPSVIDICVPPGPNNTYPDADIDVTNVVTITGNVQLTNIIDNNVERQPNHSVLQHPVSGQFYGVGMPGNESVPAGTYNISFDPIYDPGPNGRTGTVTFVTSNAGTHQVTVNITRCGSGQQQQGSSQQQQQQQGVKYFPPGPQSIVSGNLEILRPNVLYIDDNGFITPQDHGLARRFLRGNEKLIFLKQPKRASQSSLSGFSRKTIVKARIPISIRRPSTKLSRRVTRR